jgi:hypothetical protein
VAISPGAIPRFLARFENAYAKPGKVDAILSAASAHHRLLWIHPFLDGNGRVARLMTHAMLLEALDTGAIWSVARGFARAETRYKACLAACDLGRRNDLDGRGALSEEELAAFTRFFLETCLDQVRFMRQLVEPNRLRTRILLWVEEEIRTGTLPPKASNILEAVLYRGELPLCSRLGFFPQRMTGQRCAWPSRRAWRHVGCQACSPRIRASGPIAAVGSRQQRESAHQTYG